LLDLVAIVPSQVEVGLIEAILRPRPQDITAALDSGLLVAEARHFAFRHELARRAIEAALAAPSAAKLHARVLAHLESVGAEGSTLARIVHHAKGAGLAAAVLEHAPRAAAWAALHGAHREAAALYGAALDHAHGIPDTARAELLQGHAYQCYLVAQMDAAVQSRQAALAIWRHAGHREREGHNLRWLSRLHWFLGKNQAAEHFADDAIAILQALPPGLELAWAMSNRAQLHMLAAQNAEAVDLGLRAVALGDSLGNVEVQAHALNNMGAAQYTAGNRAGRAHLERSLQLSLTHGYSEHVARAYVNLVSNDVLHREYRLARRMVTEATSYFAARDLNAWVDYLAALECTLDFELGQWSSATNIAMQLAQRGDAMPVSRLPALVVLARLRMRRGDPGAGAALLEATALARATGEFQRLAPVAIAHAEAAWLLREEADLGFARAVQQQAMASGNARVVGELGFWLDPFGESAEEQRPAVEPAYAAQCDGQWQRAATLWHALTCPFERGLAQMGSGGEAAIREGLLALESLGATASVHRCRDVLRQRGVKGLARGPRASTSAHPGGLTQREAQVLALMAQGLTNAEIAARIVRSAKTVDHHISAILGKLQARSRAEASAMAARLGMLDTKS